MRLWSLHPRYLDQKGLVAVWREGLLALEVLRGNTKGYRYHPQLERFRAELEPVESMKCYLRYVYLESIERGYHFNPTKIADFKQVPLLRVTVGQLSYELRHLKGKLMIRNPSRLTMLDGIDIPEPHPLLTAVAGDVEEWEKMG
jgi:hypothetical protein